MGKWVSVFGILFHGGMVFGDDSGFRPNPSGFGFRNYANVEGISNLTPEEVVRLFGPRAIAGEDDNGVILVPAAAEWMEQTNETMDIGHCEGMAILSYLFHLDHLKPSQFGSSEVFSLVLDGNPRLQREIAFWWATQLTQTTRAEKIRGTPTQLLEKLKAGLATEDFARAFTVAIFMPDWTRGHAVTPFKVEDGDAMARILIYDNNFPGQERFIEVDKKSDTWRYSTASNPNESENDYMGDGETQTLFLTPCSARFGFHDADFLEDAPYADDPGLENPEEDGLEPGEEVEEEYGAVEGGELAESKPAPLPAAVRGAKTNYGPLEITLTGVGADLLITDPHGKKLGFVAGKWVNEIAGSEMIWVMGGGWAVREEQEPRYRLPGGVEYQLTLTGTTGTPEPVSLSCLGRGTELVVNDISLIPGETHRISFAPDGRWIQYQPGGAETPNLELGFQAKGADYEIIARGVETPVGATVKAEILPRHGCFKIQVIGSSQPATVDVAIDRISPKGVTTFHNDDLSLEQNEAAYFHFAAWKGEGFPMEIDFDANGDGRIDQESLFIDEK